MHENTIVKHLDKGDPRCPLEERFGFCHDFLAKENCLVVIPCPENKHAIVIPDKYLQELGYFYVSKEVSSKFSSLLEVLQNS